MINYTSIAYPCSILVWCSVLNSLYKQLNWILRCLQVHYIKSRLDDVYRFMFLSTHSLRIFFQSASSCSLAFQLCSPESYQTLNAHACRRSEELPQASGLLRSSIQGQ